MVKITRVDMGKATLEVTDEGLISRDFIVEDGDVEEKFNPHHVPAGSPEGGQFTTAAGAGVFGLSIEDVSNAVNDNTWFESGGMNTSYWIVVNGVRFFVKDFDGALRSLGRETENSWVDAQTEHVISSVANEINIGHLIPDTKNVTPENSDVGRTVSEIVGGKTLFEFEDSELAFELSEVSDDDLAGALIFEYLVDGSDRHKGNYLLDDGELVLLDFERSSPNPNVMASYESVLLETVISSRALGNVALSESTLRKFVSSEDNVIEIFNSSQVSGAASLIYSRRMVSVRSVLSSTYDNPEWDGRPPTIRDWISAR